MTSSGFGFQGEILVKLLKSGCSFVEVGVLGAEATNKTSVFRFKNLGSVTKTLLKLLRELVGFKAISPPGIPAPQRRVNLDA
jgi:dolichol-phosphate mannosyltransferase